MTTLEVETPAGTARAHTTANGWVVTTDISPNEASALASVLTACVEAIRREGGGRVEYWIEAISDDAQGAGPERAGFRPFRDLWQLRVPLPVAAPDLITRPFTEGDVDDFVAVNNRAFEWHPEQSGMTTDDVVERMQQPWFDADGFLLHHDDEGLAGFCWTKVHDDVEPRLGEIYVIAVDPDRHGRGLGEALTRAGLTWLSRAGLRVGMLYVESDNNKANNTYRRIGFRHHQTNRAFQCQA
ncbi:MAG: mycothiol synthase [Acidimicrobiales bacterium]